VIVFGSVARGDAVAESDIDLLCLTVRADDGAKADRNLTEGAVALRHQFGRRLSVLVLPAAEFVRRYRRKERLVREAVETGWAVAGEPLSGVLG
jgi:predicted nucleotidyltransferase